MAGADRCGNPEDSCSRRKPLPWPSENPDGIVVDFAAHIGTEARPGRRMHLKPEMLRQYALDSGKIDQ
jgi:hypothetical protein